MTLPQASRVTLQRGVKLTPPPNFAKFWNTKSVIYNRFSKNFLPSASCSWGRNTVSSMSNSKFLIPIILDFFLIFLISIDKFFIFCHIRLQNGSKQSLKIIYQYVIIIWVIFDPIAEILGEGVKLTPEPNGSN